MAMQNKIKMVVEFQGGGSFGTMVNISHKLDPFSALTTLIKWRRYLAVKCLASNTFQVAECSAYFESALMVVCACACARHRRLANKTIQKGNRWCPSSGVLHRGWAALAPAALWNNSCEPCTGRATRVSDKWEYTVYEVGQHVFSSMPASGLPLPSPTLAQGRSYYPRCNLGSHKFILVGWPIYLSHPLFNSESLTSCHEHKYAKPGPDPAPLHALQSENGHAEGAGEGANGCLGNGGGAEHCSAGAQWVVKKVYEHGSAYSLEEGHMNWDGANDVASDCTKHIKLM
ncbi:MAG TPA: hypothetical protein VGO47_14055 [Chlamydiales bacterium]|nr:hypothetical protein [Chlamydiales bacterium]